METVAFGSTYVGGEGVMKKNSIIGIIIAAVVIIGIVIVGMMYGNHTKNTNTPSLTSSSKTNTVAIEGFAFTPTSITIKTGTKVTWINKDSAAHTVTSDDGSADTFKSDSINKNATYSYTFNKAGTFTYHCAFHPDMTGKVIVTE